LKYYNFKVSAVPYPDELEFVATDSTLELIENVDTFKITSFTEITNLSTGWILAYHLIYLYENTNTYYSTNIIYSTDAYSSSALYNYYTPFKNVVFMAEPTKNPPPPSQNETYMTTLTTYGYSLPYMGLQGVFNINTVASADSPVVNMVFQPSGLYLNMTVAVTQDDNSIFNQTINNIVPTPEAVDAWDFVNHHQELVGYFHYAYQSSTSGYIDFYNGVDANSAYYIFWN
jgi:hypothetical protein